MKRFRVACEFGGRRGSFHVYAGEPAPGAHPLRYQAAWLREAYAATIAPEVWEAFGRLCDLARERDLPFEELCGRAFTHPGPA
jgi:hypothetical protein